MVLTMQRQSKILEMLTVSERVSVAEFAQELGVSEVTVRRDLTELEVATAYRNRSSPPSSNSRG